MRGAFGTRLEPSPRAVFRSEDPFSCPRSLIVTARCAQQAASNTSFDAATSEPAGAFRTITAVGAGVSECGGSGVDRLRG